MAKRAGKTKRPARTGPARWRFRPLAWAGFLLLRITTIVVVVVTALVLLYTVVNPPITHTIWAEKRRLGSVDRQWAPLEAVAPVMARSVVAAEDANFCRHWGFDVAAIRAAMEAGGTRGASTLSQQVVKNVFLWQGRSWIRKALETAITLAVEAVWTKRRILEVYLNVAEFDAGVFGVEAASRRYFGIGAADVGPQRAARLMAVLPDPKHRSPVSGTAFIRRRGAAIESGAATIREDGRADCFL